MNLVNFNYTLSHINNLLGSTIGAVEEKQKGADTGTSIMNFGTNVLNGAVRNEVARDMRETYGTNMGFLINNMAGYGSKEANEKGMKGLMEASLFNAMLSPWAQGGGFGIFGRGCCAPPPPCGCGGGMGMFGGMTYASSGIVGGMFNGVVMPSSLATPYFRPGFSVFSNNSFFG